MEDARANNGKASPHTQRRVPSPREGGVDEPVPLKESSKFDASEQDEHHKAGLLFGGLKAEHTGHARTASEGAGSGRTRTLRKTHHAGDKAMSHSHNSSAAPSDDDEGGSVIGGSKRRQNPLGSAFDSAKKQIAALKSGPAYDVVSSNNGTIITRDSSEISTRSSLKSSNSDSSHTPIPEDFEQIIRGICEEYDFTFTIHEAMVVASPKRSVKNWEKGVKPEGFAEQEQLLLPNALEHALSHSLPEDKKSKRKSKRDSHKKQEDAEVAAISELPLIATTSPQGGRLSSLLHTEDNEEGHNSLRGKRAHKRVASKQKASGSATSTPPVAEKRKNRLSRAFTKDHDSEHLSVDSPAPDRKGQSIHKSSKRVKRGSESVVDATLESSLDDSSPGHSSDTVTTIVAVTPDTPRGVMFNLRDLATATATVSAVTGEGLKTGHIYRSACMSRGAIVDMDVKMSMAYVTSSLKIRTIIDLRTKEEKDMDKFDTLVERIYPTVRFPYQGDPEQRKRFNVCFVNRDFKMKGVFWNGSPVGTKMKVLGSVFDPVKRIKHTSEGALNPLGLGGVNKLMLLYSFVEIVEALRIVSNPENHPVLIHCASGKDRTGLICGLILGCCDVSDEYIIDSYALSEKYLAKVMSFIITENRDKGLNETFDGTPRSVMIETLDFIKEKWGNIHHYLNDIGFSYEEQRKLSAVVCLNPNLEPIAHPLASSERRASSLKGLDKAHELKRTKHHNKAVQKQMLEAEKELIIEELQRKLEFAQNRNNQYLKLIEKQNDHIRQLQVGFETLQKTVKEPDASWDVEGAKSARAMQISGERVKEVVREIVEDEQREYKSMREMNTSRRALLTALAEVDIITKDDGGSDSGSEDTEFGSAEGAHPSLKRGSPQLGGSSALYALMAEGYADSMRECEGMDQSADTTSCGGKKQRGLTPGSRIRMSSTKTGSEENSPTGSPRSTRISPLRTATSPHQQHQQQPLDLAEQLEGSAEFFGLMRGGFNTMNRPASDREPPEGPVRMQSSLHFMLDRD